MEAFVYSWKNKSTGQLYVGYHKGSHDDGYICSSKKLMEEYQINPQNFERFIIAHGTAKDMVKLEAMILKTINAKDDPMFYNQHNGDGQFYHMKAHTQGAKEKMHLKALGRTNTTEQNINISKASKVHSKARCNTVDGYAQMMALVKLSADLRRGKSLPKEHCAKKSKSMIGKNIGKKRTEEWKRNRSKQLTGVKRGPYKKKINNELYDTAIQNS